MRRIRREKIAEKNSNLDRFIGGGLLTAAWVSAGVAVLMMLVGLGTIIFKLGVSNRKLEDLLEKSNYQAGELKIMKDEIEELKLRLAGKIPELFK